MENGAKFDSPIHRVNNRILDIIILVVLLGLFPVLILSLLRIPFTGFKIVYLIHVLFYVSVSILFLFRNKIHLNWKLLLFVLLLISVEIPSIPNFGLKGNWGYFLILYSFILSLFYGRKYGFYSLAYGVSYLSITSYFYIIKASGLSFFPFLQTEKGVWLLFRVGMIIVFSFLFIYISDKYRSFFLGIIAQLNESNKKLEDSESHYRTTIELAVDCIVLGDSKGNFIHVNTYTSKLSGYSKEELLSMNINELILESDGYNKPLRYDLLMKGEVITAERSLKRKDGTKIAVEMRSKRMPNGTYQSFIRDISERKKAEREMILAKEQALERELIIKQKNEEYLSINEELRQTNEELYKAKEFLEESEMRFKALHSASFGGIGIHDKGIILECNQGLSDLTGYSYEELIGMDGLLLIAEDWREMVYQKILNHEEQVYEAVGLRKDGKEIPLKIHAKEIPYKGKMVRSTEFRDISEHKATEKILIEAKNRAEENNRLKNAFLQNMSHEIRTPMNAIIGFSDLMGESDMDNERRKRYLNIIQNSSKQLLSIVTDILTISSLETNQVRIEKEKLNLNEIVDGLYNVFRLQSEKKGIVLKVRKELSDNQAEITSDKTKVIQIFSNLISNALKFTEKGYVEFGYTLTRVDKKSKIECFVKDTGIGIDIEKQGKIFERFVQADKTIQENYGGTGLGLAISKEFVELLGGSMTVKSNENKGTIFYFTLSNQYFEV